MVRFNTLLAPTPTLLRPLPQLAFENVGAGMPLDGFMVQFNKNSLGLAPGSQVIPVAGGVVAPGAAAAASLPVVQNASLLAAGPASPVLQVRRWAGSVGG